MNKILITILLFSPLISALLVGWYMVAVGYGVFILLLSFVTAIVITRKDKNKFTVNLYTVNMSLDNIHTNNECEETEKYSIQ